MSPAAVQERSPQNAVESVEAPRMDALSLEALVQRKGVEHLDDPHRRQHQPHHQQGIAEALAEPPAPALRGRWARTVGRS